MKHLIHLCQDAQLQKAISNQAPLVLVKRKKVYLHLCNSIMGQQLNVKVAAVIYERFLGLYPKKQPSLQQIIGTPFDTLRSIGLSRAKAQYVHNVAAFFIDQKITDARIYAMTNEELVQYLTQIKGVGAWTVQMVMMFTLAREDVFAVDDLGIQKSIARLYALDVADKKLLKEKMLTLSAAWSPYRTYACRYLWGWKD